MKFEQFKESVEAVYHGKFPLSYCRCFIYKCMGKSLVIDCLLAENRTECTSAIASNDMFSISFSIVLPDGWEKEDELPENLVMEAWGRKIRVKPQELYLYCNYLKIPYRKSKGSPDKLVTVFGKFVDKLYSDLGTAYKEGELLPEDMERIKAKRYYK